MFLGLETEQLPIFNVFPLQTHVVGMRILKVDGDIDSSKFAFNQSD